MAQRARHYNRNMGLKTWKKWTDWPLMVLSVVFLVVYSWEILSRTHIALCETVINVIWVVFVVDYVVSLWLADDRWRWFKHNLFTLLTIALPMLRPLRLLRLLTVLHVLNRTSGMAVRGRITVYAVGAVGMLMYVGALAVYSVERGTSGSTITDFGTALWWAFVTVTTVGYGDFSPVTFQGKIIAVVLMFTGIALIGHAGLVDRGSGQSGDGSARGRPGEGSGQGSRARGYCNISQSRNRPIARGSA